MLAFVRTALVAASLPLPVAWLMGRRMLQRAGEATFAEEWWRHRVRMRKLALLAAVEAAVLAPRWFALWIAVVALASWIGNFESQKRLYAEEWSLPGFLWWRVRTAFGVYGIWLLYLAAPFLIALHGPQWALPLLVLLVVWQLAHEKLLLLSIDARPVTDEVLRARFAPIIAKATCPEPRVVSIGPRRGFFANAFAWPGPRRGSILLTDTLLRNLEPDEVMGIFAHEMAHLEELTPRKTARQQGRSMASAVFSIGLTWAAARQSETLALAVAAGWLVLVVATLVMRARKRQHHETAGDIRAVELCGDVEAVIGGLTRTYLLSRTPRRWDSAREARLTHPSLARRIQALRKKYGGAPVMPPALLIVRSRKRAGDYFVFEGEVARWLTGVPAETPETIDALTNAARSSRQIPYDELTAIHVRPAMNGPLLVYRLGKEEAAFPLHRHDVAAVQAALDQIDIHLAPPAPEHATPGEKPLPRVITGIGFIISLLPGITLPAAIALAVAFFLPGSPTMAAAGVTALAAAVAAAIHPNTTMGHAVFRGFAVLLGALGCAAFVVAFRGRGDARPRGPRVMLAALLACTVVAALPLLLSPRNDVLVYIVRYRPSLTVSLFGLAALLAFAPRRGVRVAALLPLALGGGVIILAVRSPVVFDAADPLSTSRPPRNVPAPRLLAVQILARPVDLIRLSPDGAHFVARERAEETSYEDLRPATFLLGSLHGTSVPLNGDALAADFVAADRLALYEIRGTQARVRIVTLDGREAASTPVAILHDAAMTVDGSQWAVIGDRGNAYTRAGSAPHTWPQPSNALSLVDAGSRLVYVKPVPMLVSMISGVKREDVILADERSETTVSRSPLETRLQRIPGDPPHILYFASNDSRTTSGVLDLSGDLPRATPVARLPEVVVQTAVTPDRRVIARTAQGGVLLFNARTGVLSKIAEAEVSDPIDVAINGHVAAVVQWTPAGSRVLFYSTETIE